AFNLALQGDWKVDLDPAIHSTGFKMGREIFWDGKFHTTIRRSDIDPFAVPTISSEFDRKPTVCGTPLDAARESSERDAAVDSVEFDHSTNIGNAYSSIVRLE